MTKEDKIGDEIIPGRVITGNLPENPWQMVALLYDNQVIGKNSQSPFTKFYRAFLDFF
jgi:hypothetical protein